MSHLHLCHCNGSTDQVSSWEWVLHQKVFVVRWLVQSRGLVVTVTSTTSALGNQSWRLTHGHQHQSAQLQITLLALTRQQKWMNQPLRHRNGAKLGSIPKHCGMVGCISVLTVTHKSVWSVLQTQGHIPRTTQSWSGKQRVPQKSSLRSQIADRNYSLRTS